jgi:hypothetical protein
LVAVFVIFCVPVVLSFFLLLRPGVIEWAMDKLLASRFPGKAKLEGLLRRAVAAVTVYQDHRNAWIILATVGLPTVAGEGAREFTALGLLRRVGVNESAAWLVGHLGFWAAEFVPAVIGGIILALRPARYRPDIERAGSALAQREEGT